MIKIYSCLSLFSILLCSTANGQWNNDATVRNAVCIEPGTQTNQQLCTDGANGAYIVWEDLRNGLYANIYAQWIDSAGYTRWAANGIPVSDTGLAGNSIAPSVAPDGENGAFVVWSSNKLLTYTYAQRIGRNGNPLWQNNASIDTINNSHSPIVIADGHGGAIINWYSNDTTNGLQQIFIQWLDSTGKAHFAQGGLQVSFNNVPHSGSLLATDNNYNAYIIFGEEDTLRMVKVDTSGNLPWGQSGKVFSTTYDNFSTHYSICSDTKTGLIAGWSDNRNVLTRDDLYAQKLDTAGNILWGDNALLVDSSGSITHANISVSPDENGGAYFSFGAGTVYTDRVTANGAVAWNAPVPVDTLAGENFANMVADGQHGVILAWDDQRNGTSVYSQRIDSNGNYIWGAAGAQVYTGFINGVPTGTQIISLNNGYAIAAMSIDSNDNTTGADIFAAQFNGQQQAVLSVMDITNNLQWNVYPNPTAGQVYVKNNSASSLPSTIHVYNEMGQLLNEQKLTFLPGDIQHINLQQLPDGMYFIKLMSENGFNTVCVAKQGW